MKKLTKATLITLTAGFALFIGCGPQPASVVDPSYLPQDVKQSCIVTPQVFNTWFASGTAAENGAVNPANSVAFPHNNNCDFYAWSHQMFLWITSEEAGKTIMESPLFYTVTPKDAAGNRQLIPHAPGTLLKAAGHIPQDGPNKMPLIFDKKGNMFEVEVRESNEKLMVNNESGKAVEVDRIDTDASGVPKFIDKTGKEIKKPKALLKSASVSGNIVREFKSGSKSFFLDANGNIIDTETAQATGDALLAQNNQLLYYITMVNDVYAHFLTGSKNHEMSGYQFPTTAADRDSICAIARAAGATLPDSNALAIELKTSWIEAVDLPDSTAYVIIDAIIPTYDKSNPNKWIPNGERQAKLALLGAHIVGSVAHHPEMIWATFEHEKNAPNGAYTYIDSNNVVKTVPQDTGSNWLLSSNAADPNPNISHIRISKTGDTLLAAANQTISPSNTLRKEAWGCIESIAPNKEDGTTAASNSEVISINNNIRNMLLGNDIRKNYFMIGATWTNGGAGPSGLSYTATDTAHNNAIGTSQLANSTMETNLGQIPFFNLNNSCFRCHCNSQTLGLLPGDLSHVYDGIESLSAYKNLKNKK